MATPSPSRIASPTNCTNVYADPTFVDALPAPICADMLAQNECGIPAIRARCNFTCTGCTSAPTIPPTQTPTNTPFAEVTSTDSSAQMTVPQDLTVSPTDPPPHSSSTNDSGNGDSRMETIIIIVLASLLVSLLLLFVHRERRKRKAMSRRASSGPPRELPAVPNPAFARHGVHQDDGGYVAGSNQMHEEPTPVCQEPTAVLRATPKVFFSSCLF